MLGTGTLGDIRASVKQWSQRKNIDDGVINDFINIATARALRSLRIPPMEKTAVIEIDDDGYFLIPSDFIELKEAVIVRSNQNIILERKSIHEVDFQNNESPSQPCFIARYQGTFRVGPYDNPAGVDEVNFYYYAFLPPLVDDTNCNWLSSAAPELILYGALEELSAYTRDEEGQARWGQKFNGEISILQGVEDRSAWAGGTLGITLAGSH